MGIHILGTGSYTPPCTLTNADLSEMVETNDEWIRTRTGISVRHVSDGEPTWYMGVQAAQQAIATAGIDPADIGLIIDTPSQANFVRLRCPVSFNGKRKPSMQLALT